MCHMCWPQCAYTHTHICTHTHMHTRIRTEHSSFPDSLCLSLHHYLPHSSPCMCLAIWFQAVCRYVHVGSHLNNKGMWGWNSGLVQV